MSQNCLSGRPRECSLAAERGIAKVRLGIDRLNWTIGSSESWYL